MGRHNFLSIRDFSPEEIQYLLDLAREMKAYPSAHAGALKGKTLAMIFEKPSLRTRVSFDVGIQQLGGFSLYLSNAEINLGKRESDYDVAKNLERMVQAIMIRTYAHEVVEQMAEYASIPIINGLTDFSHPCQAMADYLTMLELKDDVRGLKIAFVGDGNNVGITPDVLPDVLMSSLSAKRCQAASARSLRSWRQRKFWVFFIPEIMGARLAATRSLARWHARRCVS